MAASPPPLDASGTPEFWAEGGYNIAFRLGVEKASKPSACEDIRRITTDADCETRAPIQQVSRDHMSPICMSVCRDNREWVLFKADHEADYKQLLLRPRDMGNAIISCDARLRGTGAAFSPEP